MNCRGQFLKHGLQLRLHCLSGLRFPFGPSSRARLLDALFETCDLCPQIFVLFRPPGELRLAWAWRLRPEARRR